MSRRKKSYTELLKENRELLLHDKIEVERIYTKIDQKAINEKRKVSKCNHDWLKFERCLQVLKKFATLLPKNWLAETPQTLALMRLGRQSTERERISETNWNVF